MSENSKSGRAGCRLALIGLLLALIGLACAGSRTEEIAEQYGYGEPQVKLEPFVIVPGFLGSTLVDKSTGHEVWGLFLAGEQRIWRPDVQRRVALPMTGGDTLAEMRDEVEPTEVMMNAHVEIAGKRFTVNAYPGILWAILSGIGDPAAQGGQSPSKGDLRAGARAAELGPRPGIHPVAYDWRRDISESAAALDRAVDAAYQEKLASGLRGEAARVDILAHSMGTLVTRYYLRYGTQPLPDDGSLPVLDWRGAERVRRVLLTAPPINGSLEALRDVTRGGTPEPPIPSHPAAVLGSFASLYQMMPHPSSGAVVYADDASPVDFYDLQTWDHYGWGPLGADQDEVLVNLMPELKTAEARRAAARRYVALCLARGIQLNRALDIPSRPPAGTTLHVFLSDTLDTPGRVDFDRETGEVKQIHDEPGDGTVTRRSALGRMHDQPPPRGRLVSPVHWTSVHFVDGDHLELTGRPSYLDDALYLLLEAPIPADPAPTANTPGH